MKDNQWHLYIVETQSGILYTGITTNVARRIQQHELGKGAKFLRGKGPLVLRMSYACPDRSAALQLEHRVKQLTRSDKLSLIESPARLSELLTTD